MTTITFQLVLATDADFTEDGYLSVNPDVAMAVKAGRASSGASHFRRNGKAEGRKLRVPSGNLKEMRQAKMDKLRPSLRADMSHRWKNGKADFLTPELSNEAAIIEVENISAHNYDRAALDIIDSCKDGLVLDCGAGRRDVYFDNVVNLEIVDYDTTDVLGIGEELPFENDTFDAVFSLAVLEHVRDPFRCAKEISRVLKPGGKLYCAMPFLQPVHGYPNHYFNATPQGLRRLFEDYLETEPPTVTEAFHPVWALSWILNSWAAGLEPRIRSDFEKMTVSDLMRQASAMLNQPFAASLPIDKQHELACGSVLLATKPTGGRERRQSLSRTQSKLKRLFGRLGWR